LLAENRDQVKDKTLYLNHFFQGRSDGWQEFGLIKETVGVLGST